MVRRWEHGHEWHEQGCLTRKWWQVVKGRRSEQQARISATDSGCVQYGSPDRRTFPIFCMQFVQKPWSVKMLSSKPKSLQIQKMHGNISSFVTMLWVPAQHELSSSYPRPCKALPPVARKEGWEKQITIANAWVLMAWKAQSTQKFQPSPVDLALLRTWHTDNAHDSYNIQNCIYSGSVAVYRALCPIPGSSSLPQPNCLNAVYLNLEARIAQCVHDLSRMSFPSSGFQFP